MPWMKSKILKNAPNGQYTMPTWSELELLCLNADIHLWYDDFVLVGGVPRHLIPIKVRLIEPRTILNRVLGDKGGLIAEASFKFSFSAIDLFLVICLCA